MRRAVGLIAAGLMLMLSGCATESVPGKDTVALVRDADLAYSQGNWSRAESQYRQITQRVPGDAYAWFKLGNLYLRTDRPNEAMYAYQQTLARDNTYAKAYHNLALLYLLQGQRTLEAGIKADNPNDPQLPASRALLAQLTSLAASGPSDKPLSLKATNRETRPPVTQTSPAQTLPAHTSVNTAPPNAIPSAAVDATRPVNAEPDQVIIEVDPTGHAHRITPGVLSPNRTDSSTDPVIIQRDRRSVSPSIASPAPEDQSVNGGTRLTVVSRSLFLREAPNPTAAPVLGLNSGDIVIALDAGAEAGWRRVRRDSKTGWVYARYLRAIAPDGSTQTSQSSGRNP